MKNIAVLIVEDEAIVALDLESKLVNNGYSVIGTADSYEEAMEILDHEEADVILMDIMIKGEKTGIDLAKSINDSKNIPVIFLTANKDEKIISEVAKAKPYGFISKPYDLREVISTIEIARHKYLYELSLIENEKKLQEINLQLDHRVKERTSELEAINNYLNEEVKLRNEIEKLLINSEKLYKDTINNLGSGLSIVAPKGTIITVNNALCSTLNISKENLEGQSIDFLISETQWLKIKAHFDKTDENLKIPEIKISKGEGSLWCNLFLSMIYAQNGDKYYLFSIIDIDQQKKNERLLQKERKRRTKAILEGEEKERKRIAQDLHDGLGQKLTAAKLTLGALLYKNHLSGEDRALMDDAKKIIEESIQEVREISNNLMSSVLNDFGLEAAVEKMCENLNSKVATEIAFSCETSLRLLPEVETALYRIVQESVNNALKYAKANRISVRLYEQGNEAMNLQIKDDGIGFDLEETLKGKGNGLFNVRERCSAIKAKINVNTSPTNGTEINVKVPV